MRILNAAFGAILLILVASPALAGDPRGGGHSGGGSSCGGGCGGGGHMPPAPPPSRPPHGGGYTGNINVNVNANANASAYAGASAGSYFNARAYDVGGIRGRGYGGGTVYTGGGYGGDGGGYYGGGAIYNEEVYEGQTCASAPFGYVVAGFGRQGRRPPTCLGGGATCRGDDRGGRYGYSERRGCGGARREEDHSSYEQSGGSYETYESYEEYESYSGGYGYEDRGGSHGGRDCGCRGDDHAEAPYPPRYLPEPPHHYEPAPPAQPRPSRPPRQHYSQEPGERG